MLLSKSNIDTFQAYIFGLVILTLPFPMLVNNLAILLFVFVSLFKLKEVRLVKPFQFLFFPLIFLLSALSLIYSCDFTAGFKSLEKIVVFAAFFLFVPTISLKTTTVKKLLLAFANLQVVLLLYLLITASYLVLKHDSFFIFNPVNLVNENFFFYHRFAMPLEFHAVYLAVYFTFAAFIFLHNLQEQLSLKKKIFTWIKILFLLLGVLLLQSFAVLAAGFVILIYAVWNSKVKINFLQKSLVLVLLLALPITVFIKKAKQMSTDVFSYQLEDDIHNKNWNSLNIRLAKWECAWAVIQQQPVLGTSTGCGRKHLDEMYRSKNFQIGYEKSFSTHNQYLHYWVELGIFSFLLFVAFLISGLYYSAKKNNFLLFVLLMLIAICSLTENILTLNKGIVFFAAFYYLILCFNPNEKT